MLGRSLAGSFLVVGLAAGSPVGAQPSFQGLGDLPGGSFQSIARAVSADGRVVVGASRGAGSIEPCRWEDGVLSPLPPISGGWPGGNALDVSEDGSVIVGSGGVPQGGDEAFRWQDGVTQAIAHPLGHTGVAFGVSADGAVAVGWSYHSSGAEGFRFENGVLVDLGDLVDGAPSSLAYDTSADGSTIVGRVDSPAGGVAVRWENGGITPLGELPGGPYGSVAFGISADGSTVVGQSESAAGMEAFRWRDGVMQGLGDLPGGRVWSSAEAVADEGWIVGYGESSTGSEAFLWREGTGLRRLRDVLEDEFGLTPHGWALQRAYDITPDGRTIVGEGTNPSGRTEGWIVVLDLPECRDGLDNDGDGFVDFPDDAGCAKAVDASEGGDCRNGIDDDGDGLADHPADPGCSARGDGDEGSPELPCDNGLDDDADGFADFPDDASCAALTWSSEAPECSDGIDNDGDGDVDHSADAACDSFADTTEALQEFFEADLLAPGDGLVTRDRNTGFDWLDLTATTGLAYVDVLNGAGGWRDQGWRHATLEEVCLLDRRLTVPEPPDCAWVSFGEGNSRQAQQRLLGVTRVAESSLASIGIATTVVPGYPFLQVSWSYDASWDYAESEFSFPYDAPDASPEIGHVLVRPSPPDCADSIDGDGDGVTDFPDDPGCTGAEDRSEELDCADGLDNDGDGRADFPEDAGCRDELSPREDPACDDRVDNDGDGLWDSEEDPACVGQAWADHERIERRACGLGFEGAVLLLPVMARRWRTRRGISSRA